MSVLVDGKRYHIAITRGSETYGFMIVKGSDTRQRVNDWAPIYSTGDQQFAEGTWQPWALSDFSGGLSQERYSNSAQNRFYSAKNCETRITGRATLGGTWALSAPGAPATSNVVDYANKVYYGSGNSLRRFDASPGPAWDWDDAWTAAANIVHLHVDGSFLYLALGPSETAYKYDGTNPPVSLGANANCFATFAGKLWRALANHLYGSADAGATWPTDLTVGDASTNITALFPYNQKLYIGKEDGLWSYDGANVSRVLDFARQAYAGNFRFMCEWGGSLYFNVLRRVIRFTATAWNDITPEIAGDAAKEHYGFGMPVMYCAMPSMVLVAFQNGENQYANLLGYTGSAWHPLWGPEAASGGAIYAVGYSRVKDCIWVNNGDMLYQAQIPYADRCSADYEPSGELVTPWFDGGYPFCKKAGRSVTLETRDCSATETIGVSYQTQEGGAWTLLGSRVVSSNGPTTISLDPLNGAIEFHKIRFKLTFARGADAARRPVLLSFILHYLNRPASVFAYGVTVKLSSRVRTLVA